MKRCKKDFQFFFEFDLFGQKPELYFKGKSQRISVFGRILTYFYIFIYIAYFIYKIVRIAKKLDISFYESYSFSGIPSISLNNDNFYIGFNIGGKIDETLYHPVGVYYEYTDNKVTKSVPLELEICRLEKFGAKYRDLFNETELQNFYCIKDVKKITLEGNFYSNPFKCIGLAFYPCVGTTQDGRACKTAQEKNAILKNNYVIMLMQDIELTPKLYSQPSQPLKRQFYVRLFQEVYSFEQYVIIETDNDLIGFQGLSKIDSQIFLKYDESFFMQILHGDDDINDPSRFISSFSLQLSSKVLTQTRENTKLLDVLGDVGGLMEIVSSFFNIIATLITNILYEKALINNLFSFDLEKKFVLIKNNKKIDSNNIQSDNNPNIYIPINKVESSNLRNLKDDSSNNSRNTKYINEKHFKAKKRKKKKKIISNISSLSRMNEKNKDNKNVGEEEQLKIPKINNYSINEIQNNNNQFHLDLITQYDDNKLNMVICKNRKKDDIKIIDHININWCCIYFFFCFTRRRKTLENILMDEGMQLIKEKMDIMNIFRKINIIDAFPKDLVQNGCDHFEMSNFLNNNLSLS